MDCMKISGVYQIKSISYPERLYIGSAVNIKYRWKSHLRELKIGKHGNHKLQYHFNKYGDGDLQFSILCQCERKELITKEQFFIDYYNPYFNICKIAGSKLGVVPTKETCDKISRAKIGRKDSDETRKRKSMGKMGNKCSLGVTPWNKGLPKELNPLTGRKQSKDTIDKKSKSLKGHPVSAKVIELFVENSKKGRTPEANKKRSDSLKGRPSPMKGKKHTPEAIEKQKSAQKGLNTWSKGKKMSAESSEKKRTAMMGNQHAKGYKPSKETLKKKSDSMKKYWANKKQYNQ